MKAMPFLLFVLAAIPLGAQSVDPKPSPTALLSQDELEPPPAATPAASQETPGAAGEAIRPIESPSKRRSFRRLKSWGADSRDRLRQVGERHRVVAAQRR